MSKGVQKETLSALLDGEVSELELRRVLRDFSDEDRETWSRWQLARDMMTGHQAASVPAGFSAGVVSRLGEQESAPSGWTARMGRLAVAASVAAATVVGWQFMNTPSNSTAAPVVAQESRLGGAVGTAALVAGGNSGATVDQERQPSRELDGMVLRHSDLSARHSGQGVTPYARFVSMQARHGSR